MSFAKNNICIMFLKQPIRIRAPLSLERTVCFSVQEVLVWNYTLTFVIYLLLLETLLKSEKNTELGFWKGKTRVHKIGVGGNFGIGQKNGLCQNKMEWVKIKIVMVSMSCYFIILCRNYVLCRLSGSVEAGGRRRQIHPQFLKTLKSALLS